MDPGRNACTHSGARVEAGYIWVNTVGSHFRAFPYGGYKNSGVGREESIEELFSYTQCKAVTFMP